MIEPIRRGKAELRGGWRPSECCKTPPVFEWPWRPIAIVKWVFGYPGYLLPWTILFALISVVTWSVLTPTASEFTGKHAIGWVGAIFVCNLVMITLFASILHIALYVRRTQGAEYKYSNRWLATNNSNFTFRNQVKDNAFWTIISAVPIWTTYEVMSLWAQANNHIPTVSWSAHPVYCTILMLFVIPISIDVHFYVIHRMLHWPLLYRTVHSLHHRNVNTGPWSGLAMHPIEHVLLFSPVLLLWILPSHPLHVVFALQTIALSAVLSHVGFGKIALNRQTTVETDFYFHYLHHKYFEVNYAGDLIPIDKWFGTFHDGSEEAHAAMINRLKRKR
jgi:sterol desaturase/sphingolipid hydroxylase (fatty acid hydroxylase superfamily)